MYCLLRDSTTSNTSPVDSSSRWLQYTWYVSLQRCSRRKSTYIPRQQRGIRMCVLHFGNAAAAYQTALHRAPPCRGSSCRGLPILYQRVSAARLEPIAAWHMVLLLCRCRQHLPRTAGGRYVRHPTHELVCGGERLIPWSPCRCLAPSFSIELVQRLALHGLVW